MKNFKILGSVALSLVLLFTGLHIYTAPAKAQTSSSQLFQTINGFAPAQTAIPFHVVTGTVTLAAGTGTVTFSGNAVFTSSTSYFCAGNTQATKNTVQFSETSGTAMTVNGTTTDVVQFICAGN